MAPHKIRWTNDSVLRLAGNADPISVIEAKARDLVLRAKDAGWTGPPYNPFAIAELLNIPVEANVDVADARTVPCEGGVRIQFNPTQIRERVPDYPYNEWRQKRRRGERVVELAVDYGVPDIRNYVSRVVRMQQDHEQQVIFTA